MVIVNTWAIHHALGGGESQKVFREGLTSELQTLLSQCQLHQELQCNKTTSCSKAGPTAAMECHHRDP